MPRMTHPQKDALIERLRTEISQQQIEINRLGAKLAEARDQLEVAEAGLLGPKPTTRQLMARCRELNAQGVPCKLQGGVLKHAYTGALLT